MNLYRDFADLCTLLNANNVDFLIVGGYAVAFHGAPRFTGDLDILIHPTLEHVGRALAALKEFGFPAEQIAPQDVLQESTIPAAGASACADSRDDIHLRCELGLGLGFQAAGYLW